ncbi:hypothetical protein BX616_004576 [Lobosporangium transversale]|uniref:Uncharacterized protein n=1 Tax=Lobosporangium transversale TaxID=64571 RepID=A0A1Y2GWT1_9FUNG|nr:hypothetical protein BCR41DRAFT_347875 [Lobosporangium transversale]KAF9916111.1 hypothetical protein BX616_004576 [Lobosporangium transversale]ORZ26760.1 hypothetical protein BCR41DRAFT_347875 [Lobosporangium transversale]|eukprot:XP_021884523.1 hypothetical protein BCR41DRAFT_347875 [Lobosporangium transversale]
MNNNHPAGSNSGSFTDTIKGYVNTAIAKGQDAIHKAQDQLGHATGHSHSTTHGDSAGAGHTIQQQHYGAGNLGNPTYTGPQTNDAFAEVNQFNAEASRAGQTAQQQNYGGNNLTNPTHTGSQANDAFAQVNQFNAEASRAGQASQQQSYGGGNLANPAHTGPQTNDPFAEVNQFNSQASKQ